MCQRRLLSVLSLLLMTGACASRAPSESVVSAVAANPLAALDPGWSTVRPGGETICSLGSEYSFFVRPGATERLLVYFQGGGACWNAQTCDPEGDPTYSLDVDASDNPRHHPFGIFDLDNADNPLREYSMVMVPYCTGDVHLGDRDATYTVDSDSQPSREVTVHHRGYANATAALEWVYAHFPEPTQIVVAGSSAGSIPSPFYAQLLADGYPEAEIVALGDAAGSYRRDPASDANPILSWDLLDVVRRHPGYGDFDVASLGFADLYIVAGEQHSDLRLLQFDAADDGVQQFFLDLAYEGESRVRDAIADNRAEIRARVASFRSYLAGGAEHTILGREAFYSYEVNGVLFSAWLAAAVGGELLDDVECESCERAEIHLTAADASIAERALEMLAGGASWLRLDEGSCREQGGDARSLRCALLEATRELDPTMSPEPGAILEARFEAREILGAEAGRGSALIAFNNRPQTSFANVRQLLEVVAKSAREHRHHRAVEQ